jgi:RND family efflux transporter MFP subunit
MSQQLSAEKHVAEGMGADTSAVESRAQPRSRLGYGVLVIGFLAALGLAGALVATLIARQREQDKLDAAAARSANEPPTVAVATARLAPAASELNLPGNALAFREAGMYARTTGYLKGWKKDRGDRVREGELLAEIAAPDVDDQLAQARANLILAKANLEVSEANLVLAKITLSRDVAAGLATSPLTLDQDRAQVKTTEAQVASAKASIEVNQATVQQYVDLQSFQKIIAPFDGVITSRNVDPGALVTADNPSETRELFHIMQTDPLRVFVNVPQVYATMVAPGQQAIVYRLEEPLKLFKGTVARTTNALDPNTRTLLTEIHVPNPKDELRSGMYLRVRFVAVRAAPPVLIPSAAVVTRNDGSEIALLDENNTVRYRKVQLGRDLGADLEVLAGLAGGEKVVVHPGDALPEGQKVDPAPMGK